ncbi:MAG: low temperature requirement protein A, partial [Acidimicrobiales bacterium]
RPRTNRRSTSSGHTSLAFVFAFSQLVHFLIVHPDWEHIGQALLILLLLWLPWTQFTWSANAVPGNQRSIRLAFLVATAASVPMAAAVETALGSSGALFAIPLAVIHLMALAVLVSAHRYGSSDYRSAVRYAWPNFVAMAVLVLGGFLDEGARVTAWIVSLAIVVWSTIRAGDGDWVLRPGHFAERHGLIIIVALGEVIVALGKAVVDRADGGRVRDHLDHRLGQHRGVRRRTLVVVFRRSGRPGRPPRRARPHRSAAQPQRNPLI